MITLEQLGLTQSDLQDRVVAHIADLLLTSKGYNEDGDETEAASRFKQQVVELIKKRVDENVRRLAEIHVLPKVSDFVEHLSLTETNKWGEKTGKTLTFIEYLTQRAEAYMQEQVDHNGKGKSEADGYGWSGKQTRIVHLMHQHLHYSIETAMKDALKVATSAISKGIEDTVKIKLGEISKGIRVGVQVPS